MNTACNDARAKLQDRAKSNRGPEALTGSGKERVAKSRRGCVKSQQPRDRMAKLCCSAACNSKTFRSCSLMSQTPTSTLPWRATQATAHFIFNQIISGLTQMANASQNTMHTTRCESEKQVSIRATKFRNTHMGPGDKQPLSNIV